MTPRKGRHQGVRLLGNIRLRKRQNVKEKTRIATGIECKQELLSLVLPWIFVKNYLERQHPADKMPAFQIVTTIYSY